jgi:hypothetical protein
VTAVVHCRACRPTSVGKQGAPHRWRHPCDSSGTRSPTKVGNDHLSFSINRGAWGDGTQSVVSIPEVGNGSLLWRGINRRSAVVGALIEDEGRRSSPFCLTGGLDKVRRLACRVVHRCGQDRGGRSPQIAC